ncbi:ATP-dependent zinc protease [Candidatus Saccharibacteria bacterium]|nr:ATP-dependent zinc protease [Candidatus Saccharibacteria bacterium]
MNKQKNTIGRAEYVWLIKPNIKKVPARIDTGARTSAIWASDVRESADGLSYVLFGSTCNQYNGEVITTKQFTKIVVASSNGQMQERYKVPMTIQIRNRRIKTFCTLADRSTQAFPMLIGRNTLTGKFIVDVQKGPRTLDALDQDRYNQLQSVK